MPLFNFLSALVRRQVVILFRISTFLKSDVLPELEKNVLGNGPLLNLAEVILGYVDCSCSSDVPIAEIDGSAEYAKNEKVLHSGCVVMPSGRNG